MNNVQILVYTQAGTEYDISYIDDIPISLNLAIADIRQPDKRNSTFSKTINLPGTKEVNRFFELIWHTNISLNYFNPNLKCRIRYLINSVEQVKGYLQLLKITVDDLTGQVNYEISITGELGDLFKAFGDALLSDLDFSDYDHDLTKANVVNSWDTSIKYLGANTFFTYGLGYVYPLIDYGLNNGDVSNFKVKDLRPALYKKTVWDKCFALAGWTYTSNYINSAYYKRHIIPACQSDTFKVSATYQNNSQFYAGRTSTDQSGSASLSYSTYWSVPTLQTVVLFNDDSTAPYNDAGGNYNTGTGEITIVNANQYDLTSILSINLTFGNTPLTFNNVVVNSTIFTIQIQKFISGVWTTVGGNSKNLSGTYTSGSLVNAIQTSFSITGVLPGQTCAVGDKFRVVAQIGGVNIKFYNGAELTSVGQTASLVQDIKIGSVFYQNLSTLSAQEGLPISCNYVLPTNTKITEWITNEIALGNLYFEIDKTKDKNVIIEDRDNFYTGTLDWTSKRDLGEKRIVTPMGDLDWKRYDYTYKKDEDFYNKSYFDEYGEVYGTGFYEVTNDFLKNKQKKELIYSATPIAGNFTNGLVIPKLYKIENSIVKPLKTNIRSLYYGGVIPLSYGSWTLKSTLSGDTIYTDFPFAGDCDNPYTPTLTINWDTPKKIYYNYQLATYTDNNLKNRYYDRMVRQITDKNSKIEIRHYVLNPYDIKKFSFRNVIWDTDAYFIVNKISDYDLLKGDTQSTPVELLKLADHAVYVPTTIEPPPSGTSGSERVIGMSTTTGENNNNFGTSCRISGGSGNYIAEGASGVELTNCTNVVVDGDVVGFIGIGLSNITINNSYNNRVIASNLGKLSETVTANFTVDPSISTYYIDTTAGLDIEAQFPDPSLNIDLEVTFVRITAGRDIKAIAFGSETFSNNASPFTFIPTISNKRTFITNGINWY